jgi:hypothetical protein
MGSSASQIVKGVIQLSSKVQSITLKLLSTLKGKLQLDLPTFLQKWFKTS